MTGQIDARWPLHVRQRGRTGPVVVLMHGMGASGQSWRLVAEQIGDRARIICPDLLGFGRSPWPDIAYTLADHLGALRAMLSDLNLGDEPVVLAGHSAGAMLALEWAAVEPARFSRVALLSLPAYRSAGEARRCIGSLSPLAWATVAKPQLGERLCGVMCARRPFFRRVVPLLMPRVPPDIARDYVLHTWASYSRTLNNLLVDHRAAPAAERLSAAGVSVELLHGDQDTVAPIEAAQELAERHGWPLHTVAGGGPPSAPATAARLRWSDPTHGSTGWDSAPSIVLHRWCSVPLVTTRRGRRLALGRAILRGTIDRARGRMVP